jgi:RHS repeat-associated protein
VVTDRLGSVRANDAGDTFGYYPYGEELTVKNPQDREKFGTYTRESATGLDYANQRYYSSAFGRFNTPDPLHSTASSPADPNNPTSWNRFGYVGGDPINNNDPSGESACTTVDAFDSIENSDVRLGCGGSRVPTAYMDGCQPWIFAFQATAPYCVSAANGYVLLIQDSGHKAAPPPPLPQCPLVAVISNYTVAPGVVALFAPDIAAKISAAFAVLNSQGIVPTITSGFRTAAGQAAQQNSPYGAAQVSWHQVGEAIDMNSRVSASTLQAIEAAMTGEGLTWGGTFRRRDPVHYQNAAAGTSPSPEQVAACAREHP